MEDPKNYQPTDSELEILQVLWSHEPATVRFVHEQINATREVGYTTILKQLQRLADKKIVVRTLKGKTHYYSAVPKRVEVQSNMLQTFLSNVFQGSAMKLVMHALGQSDTKPEELKELEQWIEAQKGPGDE